MLEKVVSAHGARTTETYPTFASLHPMAASGPTSHEQGMLILSLRRFQELQLAVSWPGPLHMTSSPQ